MMHKLFLILIAVSITSGLWAQSSMRRCALLPVTDGVGGAIGFKVFEEVELGLKKSNWCTYVSNSSMVSIFSRYRENLPQYLKTKEVLTTVADRLKVGSLIRVVITNELRGVEVEMQVHGENGEDIFFSERASLTTDDIDEISRTVRNWLDMYAKTIPYDAKVNGILGDQLTLDVGKGYPIQVGQTFLVKRLVSKKKHPLLKKIVDWETEVMAEGVVSSISDNQALGIVRSYSSERKLVSGDWVRLLDKKADPKVPKFDDKKEDDPGKLGVLSLGLFGTSSSADTSTPGGSNRWSGNLFGIDVRGEGWITRQYFAALDIERSIGTLDKSSGNPTKDSIGTNNGVFKLTGGYKYLPIGFFYGPQVDLYGGYGNYSFDTDYSATDGTGKSNFSGILFGVAANIPLNREYRFFTHADFIPFPTFSDDDNLYGSAKSASSLELEIGLKYQMTPRMTFDASLETRSQKAKFSKDFKEISYMNNLFKLGASFNF